MESWHMLQPFYRISVFHHLRSRTYDTNHSFYCFTNVCARAVNPRQASKVIIWQIDSKQRDLYASRSVYYNVISWLILANEIISITVGDVTGDDNGIFAGTGSENWAQRALIKQGKRRGRGTVLGSCFNSINGLSDIKLSCACGLNNKTRADLRLNTIPSCRIRVFHPLYVWNDNSCK